MTDEPHHLPRTYRGIENRRQPEVAWTNLPEGVTAVPMNHAADIEAALLETVHTAAISIDHACRYAIGLGAVDQAVQLHIEGLQPQQLRQLIGSLAIGLYRAHRGVQDQ